MELSLNILLPRDDFSFKVTCSGDFCILTLIVGILFNCIDIRKEEHFFSCKCLFEFTHYISCLLEYCILGFVFAAIMKPEILLELIVMFFVIAMLGSCICNWC